MAFLKGEVHSSEIDRQLAMVDSALRNQAPAMKEVALVLRNHVRDTFINQVDPWGAPWKEWRPTTIAIRARKKNDRQQKLFDSGKLFSSIEATSDGESATVTEGATNESEAYADVHQFGNPFNKMFGRGKAPIPPRPSFPQRNVNEVAFPAAWLAAVYAPIEAELQKAVQA